MRPRGFSPSQLPGHWGPGPTLLQGLWVTPGALRSGWRIAPCTAGVCPLPWVVPGLEGRRVTGQQPDLSRRMELGRQETEIRFLSQEGASVSWYRPPCILLLERVEGCVHTGSHAFVVRVTSAPGQGCLPPGIQRQAQQRPPWRAPSCLTDTACLAAPYLLGTRTRN